MAGWLAAMLSLALAAPGGEVGLNLSGWNETLRKTEGEVKFVRREQVADFDLGDIRYAVRYSAVVRSDDPAWVDPLEGPVGLPKPTSEGWYHGGFIRTLMNGKRLDDGPLSSFAAGERDTRGVLDLVWHRPEASLRYRFLGQPNDDKLLLQIDLEPKVEVTSLRIELTAFPSLFTSHLRKPGHRLTTTPGGTVAEGENKVFEPEQGWSAVLYDEVHDPAEGSGKGACAVVLPPDALARVEIAPTGYPSYVRADLDPEVRQVRLALWEFPNEPNTAVLARFPALAQQARAELPTIDFTPGLLQTFDLAALEASLAEVRGSEIVARELQPELAGLAAWVEQVRPLFGAQQVWDITATERFLADYGEQEERIWRMKLAELLDF